MKKIVTSIFISPGDVESAIERVQKELHVSVDDISYIYRNDDDELKNIITPELTDLEQEKKIHDRSLIGGSIGSLAGITTFLITIPTIGPVFVSGPLATVLGIVKNMLEVDDGVVSESLTSILSKWGIPEENVSSYMQDINMGNILLILHHVTDTEIGTIVKDLLEDAGATEANIHSRL